MRPFLEESTLQDSQAAATQAQRKTHQPSKLGDKDGRTKEVKELKKLKNSVPSRQAMIRILDVCENLDEKVKKQQARLEVVKNFSREQCIDSIAKSRNKIKRGQDKLTDEQLKELELDLEELRKSSEKKLK